MTTQQIADPQEFLASSGSLHDVEIIKISIDTDVRSLKFFLEDIDANFANPDLPEYQGEKPATLVFHDVTDIFLDVSVDEGIRISKATIVKTDATYKLSLELNIGYGAASTASPKISATFRSLTVKYQRV